MADLGAMTVRLKADMANFTRGMRAAGESVKRFSRQTGLHFASVTGAIRRFTLQTGRMLLRWSVRTAKIGALAVTGLSIAVSKLASDAEETENLFSVALGKMAAAGAKWSEAMQDSLGLYAANVKKNLATFHLMITSMGVAEQQAFEMSKGLTKLAYDMASLRNMKFEDALLKIRAGLSGETEPLKRVGILLDEQTIKTWAVTNGMVEQGKELTQLQKVIARYNVLLERTTADQGDLARTYDSLQNVFRTIGQQFLIIGDGIGRIINKRLIGPMIAFRDWLIKNRDEIVLWFDVAMRNIDSFAAFMQNDWIAATKLAFETLFEIAKATMTAVMVLFREGFYELGRRLPGWIAEGAKAAGKALAKGLVPTPENLKQFWQAAGRSGPFALQDFLLTQMGEAVPEGGALTEQFSSIFESLRDDLKKLAADAEKTGKGFKLWTVETTRAARATEKAEEDAKKAAEAMAAIADKAPEATPKIQAQVDKWKDIWAEASSSIASSMSSAFADIMEDARTVGEVMTNLARQIQRAVSQAVFSQLLVGPIFDVIGGMGIPLKKPGGQVSPVQTTGMPVYAQHGAFIPRGSDRIPAMISPGEAVVTDKILAAIADSRQPQPVTINVQAIDAAGTYQFLYQNRRAIASMMQETQSQNHPIRRGGK